jgi:hypothetical protein
MKKLRKYFHLSLLGILLATPVRADFFGGDVVVLTQILANSIQQLMQLRQILSSGQDTLGLLRDINRGIRQGLDIIRIINPKFNPGLYGNLETAERVLGVITNLYGVIPRTSEYKLQEMHDRSASESIAMNGALFKFANDVDAESARIIAHSKVVNPQGAAKLTAQSLAILIGVTGQVLRTNSMMLKLMGENLAITNRKEKLGSEQFKVQYDGISQALGEIPKDPKLTPLER